MLKTYTTLDEALTQNGFKLSDVCIIGTHIMARHYNNDTYICHIKHENNLWCIDKCKQFEKEEAIGMMIAFAQNEIK